MNVKTRTLLHWEELKGRPLILLEKKENFLQKAGMMVISFPSELWGYTFGGIKRLCPHTTEEFEIMWKEWEWFLINENKKIDPIGFENFEDFLLKIEEQTGLLSAGF